MTRIIICSIVFWTGFYLGHWDARHGYDTGYRAGVAMRHLVKP